MAASFTMIDYFLTKGGVGKLSTFSEAETWKRGYTVGISWGRESRVFIISEIQNYINREWCAQHSLEQKDRIQSFSFSPKEKKSWGKIFHPWHLSGKYLLSVPPLHTYKISVSFHFQRYTSRDFLPETRWRRSLLNSRPFSSKFA